MTGSGGGEMLEDTLSGEGDLKLTGESRSLSLLGLGSANEVILKNERSGCSILGIIKFFGESGLYVQS